MLRDMRVRSLRIVTIVILHQGREGERGGGEGFTRIGSTPYYLAPPVPFVGWQLEGCVKRV